MKRLSIFLVLALLLPAVTRGEEFTEYKFWNEGKLTWDDFQDTLSLKSVPSAFVAFLQIEKTKSRDGTPARYATRHKPASTSATPLPTRPFAPRISCACSS